MTSHEAYGRPHTGPLGSPTARLRRPPPGPEWTEALRAAVLSGEVLILSSNSELMESLRESLTAGGVDVHPPHRPSVPGHALPGHGANGHGANGHGVLGHGVPARPRLVGPADVWSPREKAVVRLLSEGLSTGEVAAQLNYSERTIKSIVHDLTNRFGLSNRTHTVAYAIRTGVI